MQFIDKVVAVLVPHWRLCGDEGFFGLFLGHFSRSVHPDAERQVSPR